MDEEEERERVIEEDYYAFLNINRLASQQEICDAYRRLSRLYHPDKHPDVESKRKAEALFHKTKKAYEVLSDPRKRAIYDCVGQKGLDTEGWELVQRTRTPQEIRAEFERLERLREERRLEQRTNPKLNFTVNVNATDLFPVYDNDYEDLDSQEFPIIEISGMSCSGSVDAPISNKNTMSLSGSISTHNGTGQGNVNVHLRRVLNEKSWVECDIGAGNGPILNFKAFRTLSKRIFASSIYIFHVTPNGIRPSLVASMGCQLDKGTVGDVTWRWGSQSSMATTIHNNTNCSSRSCTFLFGIPHSYISVNYARKFYDDEKYLKLKLAAKAGTFGAVVEYGAEKRISKQTALTAAVMIGVPTGVTLKIKFNRGNQTYNFPILLSEELMPSPILYATITPIIGWILLNKFILEPIRREKKQLKKEKQRNANKERMAELRREALAAKDLMKAAFARIRGEEEARRGLIVVRALYGKINSSAFETNVSLASVEEEQCDSEAELIDVTVQLQVLVKDSKLFIHESSKSQLPGFYDPCVGDDKSLLVQYLFHNNLHQVYINDNEPLRLPKSSHRVNTT